MIDDSLLVESVVSGQTRASDLTALLAEVTGSPNQALEVHDVAFPALPLSAVVTGCHGWDLF